MNKKTLFLPFAVALASALSPGIGRAEIEVLTESPYHDKTPAGIAEEPRRTMNLHQVSGRIESVDLRMGSLSLQGEDPGGAHSVYWVNSHRTTVTDTWDKQFLKLEDLRPGQLVTLQYMDVRGRPEVHKIVLLSNTVDPLAWSYGQVDRVDPVAGRILVMEPAGIPGGSQQSYIIHPVDTVVTGPPERPLSSLDAVRPGDRVRIGYDMVEAGRRARMIVIESAQPATIRVEQERPTVIIQERQVPVPVAPPAPAGRWMSGSVDSVDLNAGTLVLRAFRPGSREIVMTPFLVHPKNTSVDQPGIGVRQLSDVRPGSIVSVEFTSLEGEKFARKIVIEQGQG